MTVLITLHDVEPAVRLNARLEADGVTTAIVSPLDDMRAEIKRADPELIVMSGELSDPANIALVRELLWDGVPVVGLMDNDETGQREKLKAHGVRHPCQFINADLHCDRVVENASVVIMLLTLQFIRPLYRERVIRQIYEGLNDQGCLIVIEKLTVQDSMFNRLFINFYYEMKRRNGYSEVEISQKREALENVLIPYRPEENRELLIGVGFRYVEEFFRWYNFCGMVAVK